MTTLKIKSRCTNWTLIGRGAAAVSTIGLIWAVRWNTTPPVLPSGWTPQTPVQVTVPILDPPEYTGASTVVKAGKWQFWIPGYVEVQPGTGITVRGTVTVKEQLGRIVSLRMTDPIAWETLAPGELPLSWWQNLYARLAILKGGWERILERVLPPREAGLAAGILLGSRARFDPEFYLALQNTGTMHIIAASGFNIGVVLTAVMYLAGKFCRRKTAVVWGAGAAFLYMVLAGLTAAIVRAGIMGILGASNYFWGRPVEAKRLLWVTASAMLILDPEIVLDVGFQLSLAATAGLVYGAVQKWPAPGPAKFRQVLAEYLYPTLAASGATLPIILWHFGRISWVAPLPNLLILPVVPLVMALAAVTVLGGIVYGPTAYILAWMAYVPLWWVATVIKLFGGTT